MLRRVGLVMVVVALACPAGAVGGGYATVGLQSLPVGIEPGEPWKAEFTVLAHGRTPFVDGQPYVIVSRPNGEVVESFPARLVNQQGLYRARVVFPEAGRFDYVIDDGYSQRHTFPPVTIGAGDGEPAPVPAPEPGPQRPRRPPAMTAPRCRWRSCWRPAPASSRRGSC